LAPVPDDVSGRSDNSLLASQSGEKEADGPRTRKNMSGQYTYCGCPPAARRPYSKWLSALVLGMVIAGTANAQQNSAPGPVLTLEQALDIALQDNRTLDNAEMDVGKAADSVAAECTKRLPKLNLGRLNPTTSRRNPILTKLGPGEPGQFSRTSSIDARLSGTPHELGCCKSAC
jgi:hypothetical protein